MDQLVNNAAKWHYMFGGQRSVPLTIRLILGRGWGQGPTHSQNLQAWFAHVPGLKVVMPAFPDDAKGLLLSSIFDDNPVVFLEHRWLHSVEGVVPRRRLPRADRQGPPAHGRRPLTIVSMSYMTIEALHAVEHMQSVGVACDLIDLRTVQPLDWQTVFDSVRRTGRLLALDTASAFGSIASEIVARVSMECFASLKQPPMRWRCRITRSRPARRSAPDTTSGPRISLMPSGRMLGKDLKADVLRQSRTHAARCSRGMVQGTILDNDRFGEPAGIVRDI